MLIAAEVVAGLESTDAKRDMMVDGLNQTLRVIGGIKPLPSNRSAARLTAPRKAAVPDKPATEAGLAFASVAELGALTVGEAYQAVTDLHRQRPQKFA